MPQSHLPVILAGTTARFSGVGRQLGYPTANLTTPTGLDDGIYFGWADLDNHQHHPALIFIGVPSMLTDRRRRVEAHLLDIPDRDYYGHELRLEVCHFHRPNKAFGSEAELAAAMQADEAAARRWFGANGLASNAGLPNT